MRNDHGTLIFSSDDVACIVEHVGLDRLMDDVIDRLAAACKEYDKSKADAPPRGSFEYDFPDVGLLEWMPAIRYGDRAVVKVVGYHPSNPKRHALPTILSTMLTYDVRTGHMTGLADGTFLTALRTGAASAVASRILAPADARVLGIIGSGAQAISQLHGLSRVFDLSQVLVHDLDPAVSSTFAARAGVLGIDHLDLRVASRETVVGASHVLCTATSVGIGEGPVFEDNGLLQPDLHINAIGSDFPGKVEVPLSVLKRSFVCPDFRAQAIREGECQQLAEEEVGPDLVDLVKHADDYASYRAGLTVFDSTGWAIEDLLAAEVLFDYGVDLGYGTWFDIESLSDDPKNPYGFLNRTTARPQRQPSRRVRVE